MSKFPNPAYISTEPPEPKDSRYQSPRIAAFYSTLRGKMSEPEYDRRQQQLHARLKELHQSRLPWMFPPQVFLGYPDDNGSIFTQVITYGSVTEGELWAMENAIIVTLVGPEGDIKLVTEIGPMERVKHYEPEP